MARPIMNSFEIKGPSSSPCGGSNPAGVEEAGEAGL